MKEIYRRYEEKIINQEGRAKMYLEIKNLKIFRIEDGEEHFIVAEHIEDATKYFLRAVNYNNLQECDLRVREIQKYEVIQTNLRNYDDSFLQLINKYRYTDEKVRTVNVWDLLMYILIEYKLQDREIKVPFIINSSTFN